MEVKIEESWRSRLQNEFDKPYFQDLIAFVRSEYRNGTVYPPGKLIFNAFDRCTFEQCRVVIIGQDPYHGPGQANGLCFSVADGISKPPSLLNIFKEIKADLGVEVPVSGNLERWASQGVLLLNATLTVRANQAASHQKMGWELFTDAVIGCLSREKKNVVYLLWGRFAQEKGRVINPSENLVLTSKHPSPMAASSGGWFGNHHFSRANAYLESNGLAPVVW